MPPFWVHRPWHGNSNMRRHFIWGALAVAGALFASCDRGVEAQLQQMTLQQKVGQLFYIRPESLDTTIQYGTSADLPAIALQEVNASMRALAETYPPGGVVLFGHNLRDKEQLSRFVTDLRALPGEPLPDIPPSR